MNIKGALFKAKEKRSETSPDYTGKIEVNGTEYNLAGWISEPKSGGAKYISLKASEITKGKTYRPEEEEEIF